MGSSTQDETTILVSSTTKNKNKNRVTTNNNETDYALDPENNSREQRQQQQQEPPNQPDNNDITEKWWPNFWGTNPKPSPTTKKTTKKKKKKGKSNDDDDDKPSATNNNKDVPAKSDTRTAKKEETQKEEEESKKMKKKSTKKKERAKKKSAEDQKEDDDDEETEEDDDTDEISTNTTSSSSHAATTTNNNTTTSNTGKKKQSGVVPSSSPHSIVFMGGPAGATMGAAAAGGSFRSPQQMQQQQQQRMRNTATTLAAAEVVGVLIGNIIRLCLLMWGTRYFANRQELIHPTQHFVFERLNDFFVRDSLALQTALDEAPTGVSAARWRRIMAARRRGGGGGRSIMMGMGGGPSSSTTSLLLNRPKLLDSTFMKTVIVVEFGNDNLDLKYLANIVSFLITQHQLQSFGSTQEVIEVEGEGGKKITTTISKPVELEIVFKIESPGGTVATFGLAAAQLERLRHVQGITTTACVDKYAASGGYMIASQAHKLVAAPFATVGSVGVIMETLNFHDLLRSYGVQPLVLKAGESKAPLTTFGAVTKADLETEQEHLAKVHKEFQKYTVRGRPQLKGKVREVCNGSVYIGKEALSLNLVDAIMTSDEYLLEKMRQGDRVLKLHKSQQSRLGHNMRFLSFTDILPHLKGKIEQWMSHPETAARLLQAGSFVGFAVHFLSNRIGKPSPP